MEINRPQFEKWATDVLDVLPEDVIEKMHNVAFFIEDYPSAQHLKKVNLKRGSILFGLYEGYHQAKRLNVGTVLPDRITLFWKNIASYFETEKEIKSQIRSTIQHEIAHHFGSGEEGARKAGKFS